MAVFFLRKEDASLVGHLIGTFLRFAGRPNPSAISFGFTRLQISAQLWGSDVPSSTGARTFSRLLSTPYKSSKIKRLRSLSPLGMARSHHGLTIASLETPNKEVERSEAGTGQYEHLEVTRDAQRKFAQDHLGTWIDALAEQLRTCDPHPFYAALGEALQRMVCAEVTRLKASPVPVGGWMGDAEMGGETLVCPRATAEDQVERILPNA